MKLELGCVQVNDIQFASESKAENEIICVNVRELKALLLEDENPKSIELEIAKPEESVRITPVKDVIKSCVKANGDGSLFPDVISKVETVGSGRTNILRGSAIVTTGKIVGFQEGIIDMCGEGAKYVPFLQLSNLVVVREPIDGFTKHAREKAVRLAGLKVADYIGKLARDVESDKVKVYETCSVKEGIEKYPELLGVAYVLVLQGQSLMHDTYVYGVDMKQSPPTILNPTELADGATLSGSCVSTCDESITYHHLSNPVIADLSEQHGKTLNSIGVVITNGDVYSADKMCSSGWTSKLCEFLGVDGTIASQENFDNPDTDLIMNCKKIEAKGIKTTIITDEYAGRDGVSQSLADTDASANAVVIGKNANTVINLPTMGKVIGYPGVADIIAGGFGGSLQKDGSTAIEPQIVIGAANEMGFNKLSAR